MPAVRSYQVLDRTGIEHLAKEILTEVNRRIGMRITTSPELNAADDFHVPSASAVVGMIARSRFVRLQPVVGDINELIPVDDRDPCIIYLQKDDLDDETWSMYIWIPPENGEEGYWVALGGVEVNVQGYWGKTEEDLQELAAALHLEDKMSRDELEPYSIEEIAEILQGAIDETDVFNPPVEPPVIDEPEDPEN